MLTTGPEKYSLLDDTVGAGATGNELELGTDGALMEDVLAQAESGDLLGQWCAPKQVRTPLSYDQLDELASSTEFQSDIGFFVELDHGEDDE